MSGLGAMDRHLRTNSRNKSQKPTELSSWSTVEAALLHEADWKAKLIAAPLRTMNDDGSVKPIRIFKTFEIPNRGELVKARLYITAQGL